MKQEGANGIIDQILFQEYHVLSLLGSGGSSSVYLAEHITLRYYRAIKCIPKTLSQTASYRMEAGLLKNLRHPGIPQIYDTREDEKYYYIIEEYVQGESLSAFVQNQSNISQETVLSVGIQLCEIIEYLHQQKPNPVLYLDFKPEHIILCGKQLKLIDYGNAICVTYEEKTSLFYGTPGFAAPEQYTGKMLNPQTDIYGIGAVLYYMLTKEVLPHFSVTSLTVSKCCSVYFKKIILKAVFPKRKYRYSSVGILKKELQKVSLYRNGRLLIPHFLEKIFIVGSQKRVGTTHIAISLVCWLNSQKKKSIYEAKDDATVLSALLSYKEGCRQEQRMCTYQSFRGVIESCKEEQKTSSEQAFQSVRKDYRNRLGKNADARIVDFGADILAAAEEVSDMVILVLGGRPWEFEAGIQAYEKLSGEENLILICNYKDKQMAVKYAEIFQRKVFCFPLDANPFSITREKTNLFRSIFKEEQIIQRMNPSSR